VTATAITALIAAAAGLITAVTALIHSVQTRKQLPPASPPAK
jgi:hypothetical protein